MSTPPDPIEDYLDELLLASRVLPAREARSLLAETEGHLRDAAEAALATGASERDAASTAVADFGPVTDLVGQERGRLRSPVGVLAGQVVRSGWLLGSIGAIAVGISGLVAMVIYWIGGAGAIAPLPGPGDLTAAGCARWTALEHGASCRQAAISDWASETMYYRIALGVLGVLALVGYRLVMRGRPALAPIVTESIATTLFVCASILTLALGVDALVVNSGSGAGVWLSATPVAVAAAVAFAWRLAARLREPSAS